MAIANLYAEDGEFLPPNAPRVTGRTVIRAAWVQMFRAPNVTLTFAPTNIVVSSAGDIGYETGTYQFGRDGPKGKRLEDTGRFGTAWKKVDGEWKMQYDIFNGDKAAM